MTQQGEASGVKFGIFPKLLIVLVLVSLLPLLVVWYMNYQYTMKLLKLTAHERLEAASHTLVRHINDWMEMNSRMLRENAAEEGIRSMEPDRQKPTLLSIKEEYPWVHAVLVIGLDGNCVSRSDDLPLKNYSDRVYFQQVSAGESMGQQVLIGKTTGLPGLALAVPIQDQEGELKGVLTASMATAVISGYITDQKIGETGYAFLLDQQGKVIAHQSMQDAAFRKDFSDHPALQAHRMEGKSSLVYRDDERNQTVIAYMKGTEGGWTLVAQQDYDEAFSAIASTHKNALLTLLITLSAVLIVAYVLSRRLTRPIRRLTVVTNEASMANFGAFNSQVAATDRSDEIGELARSVERLAVSLRVALARLQKK